ncbi:hypothetical protein SmJEL517_g01107 [Synchytrium microbalum]|uniref:Ankyrin n=1 Tax=Synchytrium microbalum TaxID=1806994 RepID=A0A507CC98_9FUNG|nr:uncharacterized protein SmJEL517_g01107 [Synchytrium microbalum]TPX37242.1 hypothetical protein SmJEL517_g01107 [Synchytrium microbalum]
MNPTVQFFFPRVYLLIAHNLTAFTVVDSPEAREGTASPTTRNAASRPYPVHRPSVSPPSAINELSTSASTSRGSDASGKRINRRQFPLLAVATPLYNSASSSFPDTDSTLLERVETPIASSPYILTTSSSTPPPIAYNINTALNNPRYSSPRSFLIALFGDADPSQFPPTLLPGTDINMHLDDSENTALHWAAALAKLPLAQYLISHGASPSVRNLAGETPLMRATFLPAPYESNVFEQLVPLLSESIACQDYKHKTILHHVVSSGNSRSRGGMAKYYFDSIVRYFLHGPAELFVEGDQYRAATRAGIVDKRTQQKLWNRDRNNFKRMLDFQDKNGDTALNIASRARVTFAAVTLLRLGASKKIKNKAGLCSLDFGINECEHGGAFQPNPSETPCPTQSEIEATFGNHSIFTADDISWEVAPEDSHTWLMGDASSYNFPETNATEYWDTLAGLVADDDETALEDVDAVIDDQGHTALHWAAALGRDNLVTLLIENGACTTTTNHVGETPLMRVIRVPNTYESGTSSTIIALLAPTLLCQDRLGKTALHHLVHTCGILGHVAAAHSYLCHLLRFAPDLVAQAIDCTDACGNTPVQIAEKMGNDELVVELVAARLAAVSPVMNISIADAIPIVKGEVAPATQPTTGTAATLSPTALQVKTGQLIMTPLDMGMTWISDDADKIAEAADELRRSQASSSTNLIKMDMEIPQKSQQQEPSRALHADL